MKLLSSPCLFRGKSDALKLNIEAGKIVQRKRNQGSGIIKRKGRCPCLLYCSAKRNTRKTPGGKTNCACGITSER